LKARPPGRIIRVMSEEPTQNLPQDGVRLILSRLDSIDSRLDNLETRLSTLEDKVDRRLQETRPIWEQVLVRLDGVEGQLVSFGGRLDGFEEELRSSLRRFDRQVGLLVEDVMQVRADQRDLDRRMDKLESKMT
jgi:ubiquinone biosynthesis protein UbiJ